MNIPALIPGKLYYSYISLYDTTTAGYMKEYIVPPHNCVLFLSLSLRQESTCVFLCKFLYKSRILEATMVIGELSQLKVLS